MTKRRTYDNEAYQIMGSVFTIIVRYPRKVTVWFGFIQGIYGTDTAEHTYSLLTKNGPID